MIRRALDAIVALVQAGVRACGSGTREMTRDVDRLQIAARCLSVLVALELMMDSVSPALWVLTDRSSVLGTISHMSSSPLALAVCWLLAAAMLPPFVVMQIFFPNCAYRRVIIKLTTYGLILGAVIWCFMAFLSRGFDYSFAVWNFLFNGGVSLSMAALLAYGLNSDQKETAQKEGDA